MLAPKLVDAQRSNAVAGRLAFRRCQMLRNDLNTHIIACVVECHSPTTLVVADGFGVEPHGVQRGSIGVEIEPARWDIGVRGLLRPYQLDCDVRVLRTGVVEVVGDAVLSIAAGHHQCVKT